MNEVGRTRRWIIRRLGAVRVKRPRRARNRARELHEIWLGSDGDAEGGRSCPRSARKRDFDGKSFLQPHISTASPRGAVKCYALGTAAPTRPSPSLFRVAGIVESHAPV